MSQNYFYAVVSGNVLHITLFMEANKMMPTRAEAEKY